MASSSGRCKKEREVRHGIEDALGVRSLPRRRRSRRLRPRALILQRAEAGTGPLPAESTLSGTISGGSSCVRALRQVERVAKSSAPLTRRGTGGRSHGPARTAYGGWRLHGTSRDLLLTEAVPRGVEDSTSVDLPHPAGSAQHRHAPVQDLLVTRPHLNCDIILFLKPLIALIAAQAVSQPCRHFRFYLKLFDQLSSVAGGSEERRGGGMRPRRTAERDGTGRRRK